MTAAGKEQAASPMPVVLVTGAKGQVGRELVRRGAAHGLAVTGRTRQELDVADAAAVRAAIEEVRPVCVLNAAAYTAVDRAETEAAAARTANAAGPEALARACQAAGVPLFHLSTDYVFDGAKKTAWREEDATSPLGVYGRTKEEGERLVRAACPRHLIIRVSWVFSAHGHNFVKTMLRLAKERDEVRVVADQHGCPTPAAAIADALLATAGRLARGAEIPWGTYHFAGAPPTTWHGFAREIFTQAAELLRLEPPRLVPISTAAYPTPAQRPAWSVLDCAKIRRLLRIPQPDWRQGLRVVLAEMAGGPTPRS